MSGPPSLCRLCVTTCNNYKSLYDDGGKANVLYEMILEYFHPKIVNLEKAKLLTVICVECFRQIRGFHTFQFSVMMAQAKLIEKDKITAATVGREQNSTGEISKPIKLEEEEEFIDLSEYGENKDRTDQSLNVVTLECNKDTDSRELTTDALTEVVFIGHEFVPLSELPIDDVDQPTTIYEISDEEISLGHDVGGTAAISLSFSAGDVSHTIDDTDSSPDYNESVVAENQTVTKSGDLSDTADDSDSSSDSNQSKWKYNDETLENLLAKWMPSIKCVKCPKSFSRFKLVRRHFTRHHPNEEFYISCCSRQLSQRGQLKDHLHLHGDPMVFICELCGTDYANSSTLKRHQAMIHPERLKSTCNICGAVCKSRIHLEDHYRDRHNSNNQNRALIGLLPDGRTTYTCKLCGLTKYSGAAFRNHRWLVHLNNDDRFVCNVCGKNCKTSRYLREHMSCHLKTKVYKCASCPGTYRTREAVNKHRRKHHPLNRAADGYVLISENVEDEMESKRNEMSCNTADSAAAPSTSMSAADRQMNEDDEHNYLNSEDDAFAMQGGDRNISSQTEEKHISLPELTIMDVNSDSEFYADDDITLAERKTHTNYETVEDDISSDYSIESNDDDDHKTENKIRPQLQDSKNLEQLGDQHRHAESKHKFACKRCSKQFDTLKGLAVHSTRIHNAGPRI